MCKAILILAVLVVATTARFDCAPYIDPPPNYTMKDYLDAADVVGEGTVVGYAPPGNMHVVVQAHIEVSVLYKGCTNTTITVGGFSFLRVQISASCLNAASIGQKILFFAKENYEGEKYYLSYVGYYAYDAVISGRFETAQAANEITCLTKSSAEPRLDPQDTCNFQRADCIPVKVKASPVASTTDGTITSVGVGCGIAGVILGALFALVAIAVYKHRKGQQAFDTSTKEDVQP